MARKKSKWLDLSAFDDGYDLGDIARTISRSSKKTSRQIKKSASNLADETLEFITSKAMENKVDTMSKNLPEPVFNDEKKRTYFNTGLFDDGYDLGDITKTILGTNMDIKKDLSRGVGKIGEGLVDTGAMAVGGVAKAFGNDDLYNKTEKFIKRDLEQELGIGDRIAKNILSMTPQGKMSSELFNTASNLVNKGNHEMASVLGDKSDSLVQSAGQLAGTAALQTVGVPWWLTTGVTSFGSGSEEALKNNASYGEALGYGAISAGSEVIFEKLSGGIKFGGKTLDEGIKRKISDAIANKTAKTLTKFGLDMAGEGAEEVLTEITQNIGKKLTYEDEKTWGELLTSEEAIDGYIESFVGGAVLGGGFSGANRVKAYKAGRDYDTGLTDNEQSVVDSEIKSRVTEKQKQRAVESEVNRIISEQEKTFGTLREAEKKSIREDVKKKLEEGSIDFTQSVLTKKEQKEIEDQVKEDLQKGYIGIGSIENALAGEKTARIKELEQQMKNTTDAAKKSEIEMELNQLRASRASDMKGRLNNDTYLQESYRQEALKAQAFSREANEKDSDITKELIESAKNSNMNDSRRMHDLFEYTNKIANDTNTKYGFVNNDQLKQLGHDVEGMNINGLVRVDKDGTPKVLINVDSNKALNAIIGHETTHLLEDTNEYKALQDIVKEYATTKGDYDSKFKQMSKLYEGVDANIENEITADLVGDYLFTDEQFIQNLSVKEPNVFQKVYDYIKHVYKMATAGSREARQLEQVKRRFDKAYKEISNTTTLEGKTNSLTEADSNTKYHVSNAFSDEIDKALRNELKSSNQIKARDYTPEILVKNGVSDKPMLITQRHVKSVIYTESEAKKIGLPTNKGIHYHGLGKDLLIKAIDNMDNPSEIYKQDSKHYLIITEIKNDAGDNVIIPVKIDGKGAYNDVYIDENQIKSVYGKSNLGEYLKRNNFERVYTKKGIALNEGIQFPNISNSSKGNISEKGNNVNETKYSLSDNQGRSLSKEQQDYFKDSKVRDENGNLLTMYHGTPNGDFTVFKDGTYFTQNKDYADRYQEPGASSISTGKIKENPKTYEVYLDIKKPFDINDPEAREIYTNDYIKGGNAMGINPYLPDAEYDKINTIDWTEGEDLRDFLIEEGYDYDGLILDEGADGGYGDAVKYRGNSYVVFSPEQVKNVDNTSPTSNSDIRYSLSDTNGRELTKEQQDFFKNSKVRDENGNLKVMYHGTSAGGHTVFDPYGKAKYGLFGVGSYFTDNKSVAESYTEKGRGSNKQVYETYLNITNPIDMDAQGDPAAWSKALPDAKFPEKGTNEDFYRAMEEYFEDQEYARWEASEAALDVMESMGYDGITHIGGGRFNKADDTRHRVYIAFNSEQVKNTDNTQPTDNPDIRYSLSGRDGEYMSAVERGDIETAKRLVDEAAKNAGYTIKGYHGTFENFTVFEYTTDINDLGEGYYFSNHQEDAQNNYASPEGGDVQTKIEALAYRYFTEQGYTEDDIYSNDYVDEYNEAYDRAEEYYSKENGKVIQAYLKLENPLYADFSGNLRDSAGNVVGKTTREDLASMGYDGIIDKFVSEKFSEQNLPSDTVHYVVFDSSQVKTSNAITHDNNGNVIPLSERFNERTPDIRFSLSNQNQYIAPVGNYNVYGKDVKQQTDEAIAPIREDINDIKSALVDLRENIAAVNYSLSDKDIAPVRDDYKPLTDQDIPYVEQQGTEAFNTITDDMAPVEAEPPIYEDETIEPESPLEAEGRDIYKAGDRKQKAYMYENPEVKPFFQQEAEYMLNDLKNSVKGQKHFNDQVYYDTAGEQGFWGTKRQTSDEIAYLLDEFKYSYADIEKGLKAIIEDHGAENNAISKRIEFMIDERLREGYNDMMFDDFVPPNEDYLNLLRDKQITEYTDDAYEAWVRSLAEVEAPVEPITQGGIDYINNLTREAGIDINEILNRYGVGSIEEMNRDQYMEAVKWLDNEAKAPVKQVTQNTEDIAPVREAEPTDNTAEDIAPVREPEPLNSVMDDIAPLPQGVQQEAKEDGTIGDVQEDIATRTRRELRNALIEDDKSFFVKAMNKAKNIPKIVMNNTDTIRLTEMVFGREAGRKINEAVFQKAIDNEARSIYWQNRERKEIKELGIKPGSKMSAAVQKYGEKQYVNKYGDLVEYGEAELKQEFPKEKDQIKIRKAARVIREKYDVYIDRANAVLTQLGFDPIQKRTDYMRHFEALNDVFSRYGIPFNPQEMKSHNLPTDINGITEFFVPQKNFFANAMERKGLRTSYDAITGIDGYIPGIANIIFHTEDIQRGRAFEELIRDSYGEKNAREVVEKLPENERELRKQLISKKHLSGYVAWLHGWTNNIAGKKSTIDRAGEDAVDRKIFSIFDTVRKQVGANMIGLNISSSLTNLIAPIQAMSKTNKIAVAKGTIDTFKNIVKKDDFVDKNSFLTARFGTDALSKKRWQKLQDSAYVFMKGVDYFSSNLIVRSKYNELISKGMDSKSAHAEAGKFAARIMGDRTKGAQPAFYNSKAFNMIAQFQLEVNNQMYSMFYDTYHESKEKANGNAVKMAAGMTFTLGQLFAFTHLFGKGFENLAGYNPTFDVIGIIATALGIGDDDEEKTTEERLADAGVKLMNSLPYSSILTGGRIPMSQALPVKAIFSGKDDYGNELNEEHPLLGRAEAAAKAAPYFLLPAGGNQLKKTVGGLKMFNEDLPVSGSYTDSGNLRFPVEKTPENVVQAAIFGQWANANARDYFDNERAPLKEKQIQEYKDLNIPISDYWEYREGLKEQDSLEEKFDYIAGLDLPVRKKNIMINNIVDREDKVDMTNYNDFGSYEEFDFATKYPEQYAVAQAVGYDNYIYGKKALGGIYAEKDEFGNSIRGSRKENVINYLNEADLSYEEKIILYKSEYNSDDTYNMDIINYLNERDDISYSQMEAILTQLGFTVDEYGNIYW